MEEVLFHIDQQGTDQMIETKSLIELCDLVIDCPHETPNWLDKGIFIVRNYNISKGVITQDNASYVDLETYNRRIKRATPVPGDLIISREAPMGEIGIIPEGMLCCLGQRVVLLRAKKSKCSSYYLLYAIQSQFVQDQIRQINKTGSIVSNLDIPSLKELQIPYADINKQKLIVDVLQKLDTKISINKQVNDNFAQMAMTLYDYWFNQFDFPDEEGKPYKSSGGSMVWNPLLKRSIPSNWCCKSLNQLLKLSGQAITSDNCPQNIPYTPIDIIPKYTVSFYGGLNAKEANSSLQLYKKNDILLGAMRVYFHRVCVAAHDGITRTTTMVLRPLKTEYLSYAYHVLNDNRAIQYATMHSSGTQQPYISWIDALENYSFASPSNDQIINSYCKIVDPILMEIKNLVCETNELMTLRNWLLPMLMNGQATVED